MQIEDLVPFMTLIFYKRNLDLSTMVQWYTNKMMYNITFIAFDLELKDLGTQTLPGYC